MSNQEIGKLNVVVNLDSTGFQNGISNLNRQMKVVQSEFQAATARLGEFGSNTDRLRLQADALSKQVDIQKQKVAALEAAYQKSVETKGADAKATQDLAIKLNKAQAELVKLEQELKQTTAELGKQTSSWYKLSQAAQEYGTKFKTIGTAMSDFGKNLTQKVTLPLAGIGAAAIKVGSDFEAQMSKVQAISGATGAELEKLAEKAKEMGSKTKFSASESAQALNYMAMAGWDTAQMLEGLEGVMMLAAASGENLATVSDIVTDALTAFGMQAAEAGKFADLLAKTSSSANTNVSMLGESFKYVAPVFGALGYSAEDAALALGLMANAGIKSSQAGTSLRSSISRLVDPPKEAAMVMQQLGLRITDAEGKMLPFKQVMDQLREAFRGLSQEQQAQYAATLFGKEAMSGMLAIINASEADYQKLTKATRNYNGAAQEMAEIMQDNLQGQLTILKSQLEGVAIQIFEILVPNLKSFVGVLQRVVDRFSKLGPGTQEFLVKLGILAALLGPVILVLGQLIISIGAIATAFSGLIAAVGAAGGALALLTSPITLVVGAVLLLAGAAALVIANWSEIKTFFLNLWEEVKKIFISSINAITTFLKEWGPLLLAVVTGPLGMLVYLVVKNWDDIKVNTITIWSNISIWLNNLWERMLAQVRSYWNQIYGVMSGIWKMISDGFDNLVKRAWDWGKNLMGTFISGIRSMMSHLWDTLLNTSQTVAGFLGFHSPTELGPGRYADRWAPNLVKMYAEGIKNTLPVLRKVLNETASMLTPSGILAGGAIYNTYNQGGNTIIFQINSGWDDIERELIKRGIRF